MLRGGRQCSAYGCSNGQRNNCKKRGISLHGFPFHDPKLVKVWTQLVSRANFIPKPGSSFLCSQHFQEDDFVYQPFTNRRGVRKDAVPSIFPHKLQTQTPPRKRTSYQFAEPPLPTSVDVNELTDEQTCPNEEDPATRISNLELQVKQLQDKLLEREAEIKRKDLEISNMKQKLTEQKLTHKNLSPTDVITLTGFSLEKFHCIFNFFKLDTANLHKSTMVDRLDQFLLTLLRLRHGVSEALLSVLFCVSPKSVNRIFNTCILTLKAKCDGVNIWPSKEQIRKFMPPIFFNNFQQCRVIIDCTEYFVQQPSNPTDQQTSFSSYKHHNTYKSLIGITPSGAISFVSDLWLGSISDKQLTLECGLMEKLEEGDLVLADRGFSFLANELEAKNITLMTPHFLRDKIQFPLDERSENKKIASHRCHVERAIGRIKHFKILEGVIPATLKNIDAIHYVCAFLCNFSEKPLISITKTDNKIYDPRPPPVGQE